MASGDDAPVTSASVAPIDVGTPRVARRRRRRGRVAASMALQVVLIAVGVFLGLAGEEWRQDRENSRLAAETLRRLRTEIVANRDAVMKVKDYHSARHAELEAYFAAPPATRDATTVRFESLQPPFFERTAWDLALANESLANIDADLAFALSRTYYFQNIADQLGRSVMDSMFVRPPTEQDSNFFAAVHLYYGDLVGLEPGLIATYDELLPAIDRALAD